MLADLAVIPIPEVGQSKNEKLAEKTEMKAV